jgi:hypothetical protein
VWDITVYSRVAAAIEVNTEVSPYCAWGVANQI